MNLWMDEWMNGLMNGWMDGWTKERMNERTNKQTNEKMNEWMNKYLNKCNISSPRFKTSLVSVIKQIADDPWHCLTEGFWLSDLQTLM